jgi:hypothetical protein
MTKAPAHIRHRGRQDKARLPSGRVIERQDKLFVIEWKAFVPCAPYDDHFIYATNKPGSSSYMCTCGSPAVVINHEDPTAWMLVCMAHADPEIGKHATSMINLKERLADRHHSLRRVRARGGRC